MALSGQVHLCWRCTKRLNVDDVAGSVTVLCPRCKVPNPVVVRAPMIQRERC